jgi:hypothetical protein
MFNFISNDTIPAKLKTKISTNTMHMIEKEKIRAANDEHMSIGENGKKN